MEDTVRENEEARQETIGWCVSKAFSIDLNILEYAMALKML